MPSSDPKETHAAPHADHRSIARDDSQGRARPGRTSGRSQARRTAWGLAHAHPASAAGTRGGRVGRTRRTAWLCGACPHPGRERGSVASARRTRRLCRPSAGREGRERRIAQATARPARRRRCVAGRSHHDAGSADRLRVAQRALSRSARDGCPQSAARRLYRALQSGAVRRPARSRSGTKIAVSTQTSSRMPIASITPSSRRLPRVSPTAPNSCAASTSSRKNTAWGRSCSEGFDPARPPTFSSFPIETRVRRPQARQGDKRSCSSKTLGM